MAAGKSPMKNKTAIIDPPPEQDHSLGCPDPKLRIIVFGNDGMAFDMFIIATTRLRKDFPGNLYLPKTYPEVADRKGD